MCKHFFTVSRLWIDFNRRYACTIRHVYRENNTIIIITIVHNIITVHIIHLINNLYTRWRRLWAFIRLYAPKMEYRFFFFFFQTQ